MKPMSVAKQQTAAGTVPEGTLFSAAFSFYGYYFYFGWWASQGCFASKEQVPQ
jgi:hypothetical protein